jgi:hypothetical protein
MKRKQQVAKEVRRAEGKGECKQVCNEGDREVGKEVHREIGKEVDREIDKEVDREINPTGREVRLTLHEDGARCRGLEVVLQLRQQQPPPSARPPQVVLVAVFYATK